VNVPMFVNLVVARAAASVCDEPSRKATATCGPADTIRCAPCSTRSCACRGRSAWGGAAWAARNAESELALITSNVRQAVDMCAHGAPMLGQLPYRITRYRKEMG